MAKKTRGQVDPPQMVARLKRMVRDALLRDKRVRKSAANRAKLNALFMRHFTAIVGKLFSYTILKD